MRHRISALIAAALLAACAAPSSASPAPPTLVWQYRAALPLNGRAVAGGGLVVIAPGG